MRGRTVILVSHHVRLCAPGASYIVALENGRIMYKGNREGFQSSGVINSLAHSGGVESTGKEEAEAVVRDTKEEFLLVEQDDGGGSGTPNTEAQSEDGSIGGVSPVNSNIGNVKKGPRKLVEEETRAVGRVGREVWETYTKACGGVSYWLIFAASFLLAAVSPVAENGWLRYAHLQRHLCHELRDLSSYWSGSSLGHHESRSPMYYIGIYAAVSDCEAFQARFPISPRLSV
jgi:hypothetical protein